MTLHNMCTIKKGNEVRGIPPSSDAAATWASHREEYKSEGCPSRSRRGAYPCTHAAQNGNGGSKIQGALRNAGPSGYRDMVCDDLWRILSQQPARMAKTEDEQEYFKEQQSMLQLMDSRVAVGN
eukprot:5657640-Pleurochrysis_carterae.AAC.1